MKLKVLLLMMLALGMYNIKLNAQNKVLQTEINGFMWYKAVVDHGIWRDVTAYSFDGNPIFSGNQWDSIDFLVVDENDEGVFLAWNKNDESYGIYKPNGQCIIPPKKGVYFEKKRYYIDGKYYFVNRNTNYSHGLCDSQGTQIIPFLNFYKIECKDNLFWAVDSKTHCTAIYNSKGDVIVPPERYFEIDVVDNYLLAHGKGDNKSALYDLQGNAICEGDRIEIKNGFIEYFQSDYIGLKTIEGKLIIPLEKRYKSYQIVEGPNYKDYYKVGKQKYAGPYGLLDENGNIIIEADYDDLAYIGGNYVKFLINGFWGVITLGGKVIIPTSRGYTSIGRYINSQKRFTYTMNGYRGECNELGQQVSKIKVETSTTKKNDASSSSSSSKLLYKGNYRLYPNGKYVKSGENTSDSDNDYKGEMAIYEDKLIFRGETYKFEGKNGNIRKYEYYNVDASLALMFGGAYHTRKICKVDNRFNVRYFENKYVGSSLDDNGKNEIEFKIVKQ